MTDTLWVQRSPLYSYGHSYTMYPSPYVTEPYAREYMELLRARLGMGGGYFRGRSGTPLVDTLAAMLSPTWAPPIGASGDRTWQFDSHGIVLLENYMNEAGGWQGQSAQYRGMWAIQLRAALAVFGAKSVVPFAANNGTTGTWTRYVGATSGGYSVGDMFQGNDIRFSGTTGASVSFPVTGDTAWVLVVISDPSYTVSPLSFSVGGTALATFDGTGLGSLFNSTVVTGIDNIPIQVAAVKVTGMNAAAGTAGAKSLVATRTGAGNAFVNAVLIPSPTPPYVYVAKEPTRNPAAAGGPNFATCRAYFEAIVDTVTAEFDYAFAVDLEPGWDNSTMVSPLDTGNNFHPGDLGMAHIADRFAQAINTTVTGPVEGVTTPEGTSMTVFEYHHAGNSEAQQKAALAYMLAQVSTGKAATGVITGLDVAQTPTASGSVIINPGAGIAQSNVISGASMLVNDTALTYDVFGPNPMGGLPRNDLVVCDAGTTSIRTITGTPNAVPTDPSVPATAIPLARLRHAASATTIPTSKIDRLITLTGLIGYEDTGWSSLGSFGGWSGSAEIRRCNGWVTIRVGLTRTGTPLTSIDQTFATLIGYNQPSRPWTGTCHIYSPGVPGLSSTRVDVSTTFTVKAITINTGGTIQTIVSWQLGG